MNDIETKSPFASKTIYGGILSILPIVLQTVQSYGYLTFLDPSQTATTIVSALGGILSIYGRLTATKKLEI